MKTERSIELFIKRFIDYTGSLVGLLTLTPLFIILSVLIKLDSRGPVLFKQMRVGKNGELFIVFKFRTMVNNAENIGLQLNIAKNDPRITTVGNLLRKWSLDELPQIINILKGEMSLVGPRPTLKYQIDKYNDYQRQRLLMKPGITGWAQIQGRNLLSWNERINKDIWYIENFSLRLDLKIIVETLKLIVSHQGLFAQDGINDDFITNQS